MVGIKSRIKSIIPAFIIGILTFVFSMVCSNTLWYRGNTGTDSSVFMYVARVILNGGMPYLDTFDHKGPLIYLINVLGLLISEYRGIYVIELITIFITFVFIYKIARLKCDEKISLLILFLTSSALFKYFELGNLTEEYALPFITISIYIFADYFLNKKIGIFRIMVCGFSFGAVCLLRPNMISVWLIMCIGVLVDSIRSKRMKELFKFILYFLVGTFIVVLPIVTWLIVKGAFADFIDNYIIFNKVYSSNMSRSVMLAAREQVFTYFISDVLLLFSIFIMIYLYFKERKYFDKLFIVYLFINVLFICISGRLYDHYGMIIIPSLAYPLSCLLKELYNEKRDHIFSLCIISYLLITIAIPKYILAVNKGFIDYSKRSEEFFDKTDMKIIETIKNNTSLQDKIIVCGNNNIIYNLSNRFAASRYSFQVSAEIDEFKNKEFYDDLNKNLPKIIVLPNDYFDYNKMLEFIYEHEYKELWYSSEKTIKVYKI